MDLLKRYGGEWQAEKYKAELQILGENQVRVSLNFIKTSGDS